ncbi:MAG: fmt [Rickettsiaceae bacterium]|jgi:methionyl-tRNA formyltransferase|nr:fmt [Rickettsiaceae bacterium]
MKVIFMGTPEFAVPSLQAIIDSNHIVQAVFTQMPKPKGRGYEVTISPIHALADKYNIPVFTPKTLRNEEIQSQVDEIDADIIVVVAYGFIIPKRILEAKKFGCLNIHPSRLPRFRGAAPLQRTIMAGDKETSVCIMQMDEGLDTGDIILEEVFALPDDITLPELHNICSELGAKLLIKVLNNIDSLPRIAQTEEGVIYAHKISKEEARINWQDSAFTIDCKIRGLNPWPGSYFIYKGEQIKVLKAKYEDTSRDYVPGTVLSGDLTIACGKGLLTLLELQRPGKKALKTQEFLMGFPIKAGEVLG